MSLLRKQNLSRLRNIEDFRLVARKALPSPIFHYLDGGAEDEVTLRANNGSFGKVAIVPDVLANVENIRTETTLFGKTSRWPLMLSPTGLSRMFHPRAELAVAQAAGRQGLHYCLSTMGTTRLEDLAGNYAGTKLFQIYIFRDRGLTAEFVARSKEAGYDGLVLTVDTVVAGNRERDRASGFVIPPRLTVSSFLSFAMHPGWSLPALTGSKFSLANIAHRIDALSSGPMSLFDYIGAQFDPSISWHDLEWLAGLWGGPLAVKGVMSPDDAARAVDCGATGVIVSNHGGRQLDCAPAAIDMIAPIRDRLGPGPDVICDGGVRRGSDIVKALALGATACSIGRPYLYGLVADGENGVERVLAILHEELIRTMRLMGVNDIADLGPRHLRPR